MPRTLIHTAFRDNVDAITTVSARLDAATGQVTQRLADVTDRIEHITAAITAVNTKLDAATSQVANSLADIANTLGLIHSVIVPITPDQLHDQAFACIRVLNQVEDLVTDQIFDLKRNNAELAKRLADKSTQACLDLLQHDPALHARFTDVYEPFSHDDFTSRAERYVRIDRLRRDIIRYFAP